MACWSCDCLQVHRCLSTSFLGWGGGGGNLHLLSALVQICAAHLAAHQLLLVIPCAFRKGQDGFSCQSNGWEAPLEESLHVKETVL